MLHRFVCYCTLAARALKVHGLDTILTPMLLADKSLWRQFFQPQAMKIMSRKSLSSLRTGFIWIFLKPSQIQGLTQTSR
jgi:hypothetical protein